jgi:hypothetical protein
MYKNAKNLCKLKGMQSMVICGDNDPSHDDWIVTKCFFSKEAMLDFCVDYLNKLDLLSDYLNDIDLSSDQYLKAKQHFGKYFIINENEEWADKVLSLEEKEELIKAYYLFYKDIYDWYLRLAIGEITEYGIKQLYIP